MIYNISEPKNNNDFNAYYYFRWFYLRRPLNKKLGTEKDTIENQSIHRMIKNEKGSIIAVARLHFNSDCESQVRYFAIDKNYRRIGLGTYLMQHLEEIAIQKKHQNMVLNARENAIAFYESLGYVIHEKTNLLFGKIQHYKMKKVL